MTKLGLLWWLSVKDLPASARDTRDASSIPGSQRSPEKEMATHSSIIAWKKSMDREAWRHLHTQLGGGVCSGHGHDEPTSNITQRWKAEIISSKNRNKTKDVHSHHFY